MENIVGPSALLQLELLSTRQSKFEIGWMRAMSLALRIFSCMNKVLGILGFKPNGQESGHLLSVLEVIPLAFAALYVLRMSVVNIRERETSLDKNIAPPSFPRSDSDSRIKVPYQKMSIWSCWICVK